MTKKTIVVGNKSIGQGHKLCFIAGPCVLEENDTVFQTAEVLSNLCQSLGILYIFKASFDKANRTSVQSFRGPGFDRGLQILSQIKSQFRVPVLTDVHEVHQVAEIAEVVDVLQIPAFLCRQTDLLIAAGKSGKVVNVKKGQFLSPDNMKQVIGKITSTGNENIMLTERGTFFGYGDLVVDMRNLPKMRDFGFPVIYDAGHSLQKPGAKGYFSGGERELIPALARAAVAAGCDGIFLEVHPEPAKSPSDSQTIWPLDKVGPLLRTLLKINDIILAEGE